jgi:DNA-binding NtrC family response regulator
MKKYIIFVDDDKNILQGLKRSMKPMTEKWDILFLNNVESVIETIKEKKPDIIIADYKMPGMNGIELLNKIKKEYPFIKRILLTGQSESEVFKEADKESHEYLSKPCSREELIEIINKFL